MPSSLSSHLESIPAHGISLEALAELVNVVLEEQGLLIDDGRTADRIDGRTIRFYQTIGILPKPTYEGRCAVYAREHLLRVIAAKQLQSEGYSLAQVQAALPARTTDQIFLALDAATTSRGTASNTASAARVMTAPVITAASASVASVTASELRAFSIADGITLMIDPARVANAIDVAAVLAAFIERSRDPQTSSVRQFVRTTNNKGTTH